MDFSKGMFGSETNTYAQTGRNLANIVGSLFGVKVPEFESRRILGEVDYNNPASLQTAAQELARMGMVDQAMTLAAQARSVAEKERSFGLQQEQLELSKRSADRADEAALQTEIKNSPYSAIGKVLSLPEGKEREALLTQISDNISASNLSTATKEQQLKNLKTELRNLEKDYEPSLYKDNAGNALFNKRGEVGLFYFDESTNKIKKHKSSQGLTTIKPTAPNPYDFLKGAMAGQQPIAAEGQPQGQAGGSLADMQARAAQALKDRMNK
jgi:hypothetical protein